MSKFKYEEEESEEQKRYKGILSDFLKDFDMKKLTAALFVKLYNAKQFPGYKRTDELTIRFDIGKFDYRIQRRLKAAAVDNQIIQSILNDSKVALDRSKFIEEYNKRKI